MSLDKIGQIPTDEQPKETRSATIPDTSPRVFFLGDEYIMEGIEPAIENFIREAQLDETDKKRAREWYVTQVQRLLGRRPPEKRDGNFMTAVYNNILGKLELFIQQMIETKAKNKERLNPFLHTKPAAEKETEQLIADMRDEKKSGNYIVIVNIDLDDFKPVNDRFGHKAGDELLQSFGQALASSIRPDDDFAAHYSGDEFGLIFKINLPEGTTKEAANDKIQEIIKRTITRVQQRTVRPDAAPQEISAGYKIINAGDSGNFVQFHEEADKASEISKILKLLREVDGKKVNSVDRVIDYQNIDEIMAGYTKREIALARAMRGVKRELNHLASEFPDTLHDVDIPREAREFFDKLVPKG